MGKHHAPGFLKLVYAAKESVTECTVHDVKFRLEQRETFHLVDVIERDIEKTLPDPTATIVLYCGGGYRSALAAKNLQEMGYTNVISMDGGFRGWTEAGYPIEQ
jgi:rhodanese-related sulfurtransferase